MGNRWVYGYFTKNSPTGPSGLPIIETPNKDYPVLMETVGQFIGRRDKNGIDIYEGDLVKIYMSTWKQYRSFVVPSIIHFINGETDFIEWSNCEVMGNRYDNANQRRT